LLLGGRSPVIIFFTIIISLIAGVITEYLGGDGGIAVAVVWIAAYLWVTRRP